MELASDDDKVMMTRALHSVVDLNGQNESELQPDPSDFRLYSE